MRDKIRIELSSESRLGWEPFYAVLDLPATAQQIRDARQKARISPITRIVQSRRVYDRNRIKREDRRTAGE